MTEVGKTVRVFNGVLKDSKLSSNLFSQLLDSEQFLNTVFDTSTLNFSEDEEFSDGAVSDNSDNVVLESPVKKGKGKGVEILSPASPTPSTPTLSLPDSFDDDLDRLEEITRHRNMNTLEDFNRDQSTRRNMNTVPGPLIFSSFSGYGAFRKPTNLQTIGPVLSERGEYFSASKKWEDRQPNIQTTISTFASPEVSTGAAKGSIYVA